MGVGPPPGSTPTSWLCGFKSPSPSPIRDSGPILYSSRLTSGHSSFTPSLDQFPVSSLLGSSPGHSGRGWGPRCAFQAQCWPASVRGTLDATASLLNVSQDVAGSGEVSTWLKFGGGGYEIRGYTQRRLRRARPPSHVHTVHSAPQPGPLSPHPSPPHASTILHTLHPSPQCATRTTAPLDGLSAPRALFWRETLRPVSGEICL